MAQVLHATLNHANINLGIPAESVQRAVGITLPDTLEQVLVLQLASGNVRTIGG